MRHVMIKIQISSQLNHLYLIIYKTENSTDTLKNYKTSGVDGQPAELNCGSKMLMGTWHELILLIRKLEKFHLNGLYYTHT